MLHVAFGTFDKFDFDCMQTVNLALPQYFHIKRTLMLFVDSSLSGCHVGLITAISTVLRTFSTYLILCPNLRKLKMGNLD